MKTKIINIIYWLMICFLIFISCYNFASVIIDKSKEQSQIEKRTEVLQGMIKGGTIPKFQWKESDEIVTFVNNYIVYDLYKFDFIETKQPVGEWIFKLSFLEEDGYKNPIVMEIGKESLSINGQLYTLETKKAYKAFLTGIYVRLDEMGFDYQFSKDLWLD